MRVINVEKSCDIDISKLSFQKFLINKYVVQEKTEKIPQSSFKEFITDDRQLFDLIDELCIQTKKDGKFALFGRFVVSMMDLRRDYLSDS